MTRDIVEPVEETGTGPLRDGRTLTHPAFGMISASRVQGSRTLFGTDFVHRNFVTVTIRRAVLHRDLSHDFPFGREELIEVHLSEAQWAAFVSSMNVGQGVQCTLYHLHGKQVPGFPLRQRVTEAARDFADRADRVAAHVRKALAAIRQELTGLSKAKQEKVVGELERVERELRDGMPWVEKCMRESMETTVEHARVEVNAYAQSLILAHGLQALGGEQAPVRLLGPGEDA